MELNDMKNAWQQFGERADDQELLTDARLQKLTQQGYRSRLHKIALSEYGGTVICYLGAAYLIYNLSSISDNVLQLFAVLAIALLLALPVISLASLRALKSMDVATKTYIQTITDFAERKNRFQKLQRLNVSLGLFLLPISLPVLAAIQGRDIAQTPYFWTIILPIAVLFFLAFARWVLKSYNNRLDETEKMLDDLAE